MKPRLFRFGTVFAVAATSVFGLSFGTSPAIAGSQSGAASVTHRHLIKMGTVDWGALAAREQSRIHSASHAAGHQRIAPLRKSGVSLAGAAVPTPNPPTTAVAGGNGGAQGFVGVTDVTQSTANNFATSLEPPDQGLCAANGKIVEVVNIGGQVYSEAGAALTPVVALNALFGLPPVVNTANNPPTFGPFLSDPRCYFDGQTRRWFVTVLEIDTNPYTGAFGFRSSELLAVSQTSDPLGKYGLFMIDSTNDGSDGTPAEANCPCFGDQPRIGADANGFYIAADMYPIHGLFNSDGGEIYAMSKTGLAAAAAGLGPPPALVDIHNGAVIIEGYPANAVQPAETPQGGTYAANTEYFLSTPDYNGFATMGGAGDTALVLWALQGTATLSGGFPTVTLTDSIVPSEAFAPPVNSKQKAGPTPYATSIGATETGLDVNDDRMQQVEYVSGQLYATLNTGVGPTKGGNRSAAAWFVVKPTGSAGTVTHQGYVALGGGASVLYPAIGLDASGDGVMTFSIAGPAYFPSAAFMQFDHTAPVGKIFISAAGTAPEDGFTCYPQSGFGPDCRWGDYSAASSDGAGHIVMGGEMIPNTARLTDGNWGTFVSLLNSY